MELSEMNLARVLLLSSLFCACQKTPVSQEIHTQLPTPPFSELSSNRLSIDPPSSVIFTATLEDTVASIKRLDIHNRSLYRSHLEELATQVFQKVASSNDPEAVIMTLLATASCNHPLSLSFSKELIRSSHPIVQLAAVQALCVLNTTDADAILVEALRSDYPLIRLEAAWRMANKQYKDSFFHIDALSYKLPKEMAIYLPELFAVEGSANSIHRLQQMVFDSHEEVVIQTLLAVGRNHITALSPSLLSLQSHSPAVLEALAFALQVTDSEQTRARLHMLATHPEPCVRIQAALSLISLGEVQYQENLFSFAKQGNLFAAGTLGDCPDPIPPDLVQMAYPKPFQLNIALALLAQKNGASLPMLKQILQYPDDYAFCVSTSNGQSLGYWQFSPFAAYEKDCLPMLQEQTLVAMEMVLTDSLELKEEDFLELAASVFESGRIELYPCLLHLLENQQSDKAILLLQREANRLGAPYNRAFATLGLIRLGIEKDTKDLLLPILELSREKEQQSWRFPLPWIACQRFDEKTPQQHAAATAKLYIETLETLATSSSSEARVLLTEELDKTPPKFLPFVVTALLHTSL